MRTGAPAGADKDEGDAGDWVAGTGAGPASTVIWSLTLTTPGVCVASLNASSLAASLPTSPSSVTYPRLEETFKLEFFSSGLENSCDLILVTMAPSSGFLAHPDARTTESTATEITDLRRITLSSPPTSTHDRPKFAFPGSKKLAAFSLL
jgi:hypothetical protein